MNPDVTIKDEELGLKTLIYWQLSQSFCGFAKSVTTKKALDNITMVLDHTNPYRPLATRFRQIQEEIVSGHSPKKTNKAPLVQLRRNS